MSKQYKISEEKYFTRKNTTLSSTIITCLLLGFIVVIIGIAFFFIYNYTPEMAETITFLTPCYIAGMMIVIIPAYFKARKNKKNLLNEYSITITNNTISQSSPPLYLVNNKIIGISKTFNGSFIIKENDGFQLNTLTIPAQMENYLDLENELESIHPISNITDENSFNESFTMTEHEHKAYRIKFIILLVITLCLFIPSLFCTIEYYFNRDTDTAVELFLFMGYTCLLPTLMALAQKLMERELIGYKSKFPSYRFTIDEHIIILEQGDRITTIPTAKLKSIKKFAGGGFLINGENNLSNPTLVGSTIAIDIPPHIENKENLERKLNSIMPIKYSRFLRKDKVLIQST